MRAMTFETPESSNIVRMHVGLDEDVVVVEFPASRYRYEVDEQTRESLRARMAAGESAGRLVHELLHPLPYEKLEARVKA